MKKILFITVGIICVAGLVVAAFYIFQQTSNNQENPTAKPVILNMAEDDVTSGVEMYRGFQLDNILHSKQYGDIHFNIYIPDSYDGSVAYSLYMTLPGYQGLYFQGVGENIKTEEFGFIAQDYQKNMIIVAPQLDDWQDVSANQTIVLTEYMLSHYNIDPSRVYANGYSGGGETMSLVMAKRPDLFTAYLHCSSKWDGDYDELVASETPIYIAIGENDEYYGSASSNDTYQELYKLYQDKGLSKEQINQILVLDIKETAYFESQGINNQHGGGGYLFARDQTIMGWLFSQQKH